MLLRFALAVLPLLLSSAVSAQSSGPEITAWILNPGSETGYAGIWSNVLQVQYSDANVYVSCTCIPGYDIGPWAGNPNIPANQDFVFRITRDPQANTGAPINTPLGHIGVWRNGVSIFNAKDGMSYLNQNAWRQNAVVVEGPSFDLCNGHPAPNGEYHHHLNPSCLYDDQNDEVHSPIIGYAFDGFPIYGAYGFVGTDGSGGLARMRSGFRLRNMTVRTTYANGSTAAFAGPAVSTQYPLGYYVEDYEYVEGLGDLDEHNGRFCVTPEYPAGIYAYFTTLDEAGAPAYPYVLGPTYYGIVPAGNTGPGSGHNDPSEPVITWDGSTDVEEELNGTSRMVYPIPSSGDVFVPDVAMGARISLFGMDGREVYSTIGGTSGRVHLPLSHLPDGSYVLRISNEPDRSCSPIIIRH